MENVVIVGLYSILAIWIITSIFTSRKEISSMTGIMVAMSLGMTIGLGLGSLLAVWLPGQFFHSSIIAMMIGCFIGFIAGAPINLIAIIDGMLSGIMGGMMGTMLLVMVPAPYAESTIKILSVICSGIIFIVFLMLREESGNNAKQRGRRLHLKPGFMFLVIMMASGFILLGSNTLSYSVNPHTHHIQEQEHVIQAAEFTFTPASIQIKAGEPIKLIFDNNGRIEHDFVVTGTSIHIHSAPGNKNAMRFTLNKPGYYQVICSFPGHL